MKADVQLEHGYVRIANRLLEAILDADFTGTQVRILMSLVRLTYGWRQKTAQVTVAQLAAHCQMTMSGGFRRALHQLIEHGVVIEVGRDIGEQVSVFAVQKDFTRWGRFSIAPTRLEATWGDRPKQFDDRVQPTLFGSPLEGLPPTTTDPTGARRTPLQGQGASPDRGTDTGANSPNDQTLGPPKDSERHRNTKEPPPPPRAREAANPLGERLATDVDRRAATELLERIPPENQHHWVAEMVAVVDGMPGHWSLTAAQLGRAIRDYLANGAAAQPNLRQFRRYLEGARSPPGKSASTDKPPDPLTQQYGDLLGGKQHVT